MNKLGEMPNIKERSNKMSQRVARRIVVITLILSFILLGLPARWVGKTVANIFFYVAIPWNVAILIHLFWLNRKPLFSHFKKVPELSRRGVMQIVVFLLVIFWMGSVSMGTLGGSATVRLIFNWWRTIFGAIIIGHVWLKRRALFSHLGGQKPAMIAFTLLCAVWLLQLIDYIFKPFG